MGTPATHLVLFRTGRTPGLWARRGRILISIGPKKTKELHKYILLPWKFSPGRSPHMLAFLSSTGSRVKISLDRICPRLEPVRWCSCLVSLLTTYSLFFPKVKSFYRIEENEIIPKVQFMAVLDGVETTFSFYLFLSSISTKDWTESLFIQLLKKKILS